jgi:hypothetical protein
MIDFFERYGLWDTFGMTKISPGFDMPFVAASSAVTVTCGDHLNHRQLSFTWCPMNLFS